MSENYIFGSEIGRGAYGEVFSAYCRRTQEQVAIKRLKEKVGSWEDALRLREVAALRVLNQHPHVLRLREVYRDDQEHILYLVFEFLQGGNLHQVLKLQNQALTHAEQTPSLVANSNVGASVHLGALWPLSRIRDVMFQLFSAVEYVHRMGFFHRDIKPENVMFLRTIASSSAPTTQQTEFKRIDDESSQDFIKLVDFGLTRRLPPRPMATRHTADDSDATDLGPAFSDYVATRWYRAPELVLGARHYSSPVDIWALGCILAELISGRPLFPGTSSDDQLFKIASVIGSFDATSWPAGAGLLQQLRRGRTSSGTTMPLCAPVKLSQILPRADANALALLNSIFQWDPVRRPTARQCLDSPFFANCRLPPIPSPSTVQSLAPSSSIKLKVEESTPTMKSDHVEFEAEYVTSSLATSSMPAQNSYLNYTTGEQLPDDVIGAIDDEDDYVNPVNLISWSKKRGETVGSTLSTTPTGKSKQFYAHGEEEDDFADSPRLEAEEVAAFDMQEGGEEDSEPLIGLEEEDEFESAIKDGLAAVRTGPLAQLSVTGLYTQVGGDTQHTPTNQQTGHTFPFQDSTGVHRQSPEIPVYQRATTQPTHPSSNSCASFPSLPANPAAATKSFGLPPHAPLAHANSQLSGHSFNQSSATAEASSPRPPLGSMANAPTSGGRHRPSLSTSSFGSNDLNAPGNASIASTPAGAYYAPHSPGSVPGSATLASPAPLPTRVATSLLPPSLPSQISSTTSGHPPLNLRALRRDNSPFQADAAHVQGPSILTRPPLSPSASPHLPTSQMSQSAQQGVPHPSYSFQGSSSLGYVPSTNANYASSQLLPASAAPTSTQLGSYASAASLGQASVVGMSGVSANVSTSSSSVLTSPLGVHVTAALGGRTTPSYRCASPPTSTSTMSASVVGTPPTGAFVPPALSGQLHALPGVPVTAQHHGSQSPGPTNRTDLSPLLRSSVMRDCPYPAYPGTTVPSPSITPQPSASHLPSSPSQASPSPSSQRASGGVPGWHENQVLAQLNAISLSGTGAGPAGSGPHAPYPTTTAKRPLAMSASRTHSVSGPPNSMAGQSGIGQALAASSPHSACASLAGDATGGFSGSASGASTPSSTSGSLSDHRSAVMDAQPMQPPHAPPQALYGRRSQISQLPDGTQY